MKTHGNLQSKALWKRKENILDNKTQPFHTNIYLKSNKEIPPFSWTKKKSYLSLNGKLEIASCKGDNLWRSELINKCRHQTKFAFYGMTARNKSYVFTKVFLALFPMVVPFWPARLMFCIIWFSKETPTSSKRRFHWRVLPGIFPSKTARKWRHPFVWILLLYMHIYIDTEQTKLTQGKT